MRGQLIERSNNHWTIRIFTGRDPAGRRRYTNFAVTGSRRDAERERTRLLREFDTGRLVTPSRQSVAEYLREWLATTAAARVRPRTLASYRQLCESYLLPLLGSHRLAQLTTLQIQDTYNALTEQGLSPRTVAYVHAVLRSALAHAERQGLIARNPAGPKLLTLPRQRRPEMQALTPAQVQAFLAAAADDPWAALWTLLATTGLRPGEAMGLKWSDLEGTRLRIRRALVYGYRGTWRLEEPKTAKARRTVVLPEVAVRALREHRRRQAEARLAAGPYYEDQGLVFAGLQGHPVDVRALVRTHFEPILARAGLPRIRLYDLRHTAATLLLANGVSVKVASEMLGHSTATLTLDVYSHVLEGMQQQAAAVMDRVVGTGAAS